jgi:hypothetical protein
MISPKERVRPVQANPQIPAVKKQAKGLKGAVMEVSQAQDKKVHHLTDASHTQEDLIQVLIVQQDVLPVEVHHIAVNQIPTAGLKGALATILQEKKEVIDQKVLHILVDQHPMKGLKEVLEANLRVKRKALSPEAPLTLADQRLMRGPKEVLAASLQVKRKALSPEVHLTLAGQALKRGLKEVLEVKVQQIKNSTDARQKVQDLKIALTIRTISHSVNQKIHPIINLKLSVTRMQKRCVAEKNQLQKKILA